MVPIVEGLVLVGLGIFILYVIIRMIMDGRKRSNEWREISQWESTVGWIESLEFTKTEHEGEVASYWTYTPQIHYRHEVGGKRYRNDRIGPGTYAFTTGDKSRCLEAEYFRSQFPPGSERPIYYDPQRPERSYLHNRPATPANAPSGGILGRILLMACNLVFLILVVAFEIGLFVGGGYLLAFGVSDWR